jgi:hypothetical protein
VGAAGAVIDFCGADVACFAQSGLCDDATLAAETTAALASSWHALRELMVLDVDASGGDACLRSCWRHQLLCG